MDIDYDADLQDKLSKNQHLWEMLAPHADSGAEFNLDYFFYTDSKEAAACLAAALNELGYPAATEKQGFILRRMWLVKGTTDAMSLTRAGVDHWTYQMVEIARKCGAHFDGWGAALPA